MSTHARPRLPPSISTLTMKVDHQLYRDLQTGDLGNPVGADEIRQQISNDDQSQLTWAGTMKNRTACVRESGCRLGKKGGVERRWGIKP